MFNERPELETAAEEQRSYPRYPVRPGDDVCFQVWPSSPPETATLRDVSATGVSLEVTLLLEPETFLLVNLGQGPEEESLPVLAEVVHVTPQEGGHWLAGCRLDHGLTGADLRRVAAGPGEYPA